MVWNSQSVLPYFTQASGRSPEPVDSKGPTKHVKKEPSRSTRRRIVKPKKLPRFPTNEKRSEWMEKELVKQWPEYIKADPMKWLGDIEAKHGQDPKVGILVDLITNGAKPVKKMADNGKRSKDVGMLPWNPHLVLVLDKLVNGMNRPSGAGPSRGRGE